MTRCPNDSTLPVAPLGNCLAQAQAAYGVLRMYRDLIRLINKCLECKPYPSAFMQPFPLGPGEADDLQVLHVVGKAVGSVPSDA